MDLDEELIKLGQAARLWMTLSRSARAREPSPKSNIQNLLSDVSDEDFENRRSSNYLQSHTNRNSERGIMTLRSITEDAIRALRARAEKLEGGINERKSRILRTVQRTTNFNRPDLASQSVSDLFKLLDRKNSIKIIDGGPISDYKEFMFFDPDSSRHLNHAIKTLGDPSFAISYTRDYNAIALHPEYIGEAGRELGQFYGPTAITSDSRHLYVCDSMNSRIVVYNPLDNQPLYSIGHKGKGSRNLDRPSSVAVDDTGKMFVADSFNDRVCVYSTEGDWKFNVGGRGKLNKPRGVACSRDGNTFVVSDTGNQRIHVYSGSGTFKGDFGKLGMKEGQFVRPQGIKIDKNKVYVSDSFNYRVQIFDFEGRVLGGIGKHGSGPGEFEEPRDMSIDTSGNVVVADTSKNTLQFFDKHGNFIREYGRQGDGPHQFDGPEGVHTDEISRVLVADRKNNRIHIL